MNTITEGIILVLVATLALVLRVSEGLPAGTTSECSGVAAFKLTVETFWTKEDFPKQYPLYRPPAQWSRLIGRIHSSDYSMWRLNQTVTGALREFVERSVSTLLDEETQGKGGVFDVFTAPNIRTGAGRTEVTVYAESKHSKLSTITLMVPSPDWFIGVHDLDLCQTNGKWADKLVTNLHLMDAGVDRGLTFSAPKWAEASQIPVSVITSKVPSHPAASFYYPELENLKPLGRLIVERVSVVQEERLVVSKSYSSLQSQVPTYRTASAGFKSYNLARDSEERGDVSKIQEMENPQRDDSSLREHLRAERERRKDLRQDQRNNRKTQRQGVQKIEADTDRQTTGERRIEIATSTITTGQAKQGRIDCEVGGWTDWSECSKTCGYGQKIRTRPLIKRPENGGTACPPMMEEQICGSMRGCDWKPFSHASWGSNGGTGGSNVGTRGLNRAGSS